MKKRKKEGWSLSAKDWYEDDDHCNVVVVPDDDGDDYDDGKVITMTTVKLMMMKMTASQYMRWNKQEAFNKIYTMHGTPQER